MQRTYISYLLKAIVNSNQFICGSYVWVFLSVVVWNYKLEVLTKKLVDTVEENFSVKRCVIPTAGFRENRLQPAKIRP